MEQHVDTVIERVRRWALVESAATPRSERLAGAVIGGGR
jgi:hypothetical protein